MCNWCHLYGLEGTEWHLNPANYARRLYKLKKPKPQPTADKKPKKEQATIPGEAGLMTFDESRALAKAYTSGEMVTYRQIVKKIEERSWRVHAGQVVTLEEVYRAMEFMYPIAKITCACRRKSMALPDEENMTCIGTGPGMYKWERWPDAYRGGVEFLHPDDAREFVTNLHDQGYVQSLWTFGTPFIGGICNCNSPDCEGIRERMDYGIKCLWKGHYVAKINLEECNGCGKCVSRCYFRAIRFNHNSNKAYIDPFQCFGCSQCEKVCKPEAITMAERKSLPVLAEIW